MAISFSCIFLLVSLASEFLINTHGVASDPSPIFRFAIDARSSATAWKVTLRELPYKSFSPLRSAVGSIPEHDIATPTVPTLPGISLLSAMIIPMCMLYFNRNFLLRCSAARYGSFGYKTMVPFFVLDLSIPAFGAMILSDDVITNPGIPPNMTSDSLKIISAILGFMRNLLPIFSASEEGTILLYSKTLPCAFATYLLEITITSPFCGTMLEFCRSATRLENKSNGSFFNVDFIGKTVSDTSVFK